MEKQHLTTTLALLHKAGACVPRYKFLVNALGVDYPRDKEISLLTILETNGIKDAIWALCATAENCDKVARLMAADFAEDAVNKYWINKEDNRPQLAIQAARDYANGLITKHVAVVAAADAAADAAVAAADAAADAAVAAVAAAVAAVVAAAAAAYADSSTQTTIFLKYVC